MACAAGIYTHTPEQLEQAGKYLEEKRAAMPAVKIVTELEPINKYYKAEVRRPAGLHTARPPGAAQSRVTHAALGECCKMFAGHAELTYAGGGVQLGRI